MDGELEQLKAAIEAHFAAHPNAADTAEGIAAWWLSSPVGTASPVQVEKALASLVDAGRVRARHIASGSVIYSLNREPH